MLYTLLHWITVCQRRCGLDWVCLYSILSSAQMPCAQHAHGTAGIMACRGRTIASLEERAVMVRVTGYTLQCKHYTKCGWRLRRHWKCADAAVAAYAARSGGCGLLSFRSFLAEAHEKSMHD